ERILLRDQACHGPFRILDHHGSVVDALERLDGLVGGHAAADEPPLHAVEKLPEALGGDPLAKLDAMQVHLGEARAPGPTGQLVERTTAVDRGVAKEEEGMIRRTREQCLERLPRQRDGAGGGRMAGRIEVHRREGLGQRMEEADRLAHRRPPPISSKAFWTRGSSDRRASCSTSATGRWFGHRWASTTSAASMTGVTGWRRQRRSSPPRRRTRVSSGPITSGLSTFASSRIAWRRRSSSASASMPSNGATIWGG